MTITNINRTEIITNSAEAILDGSGRRQQLPDQGPQAGNKGKPESELRAAARRHGLTMKELADLMGVNAGHLSDVGNGRRPWSPMMRERVTAVLGEVPGQGVVYRQGGAVTSESSFIRERAREKGMTLKDLAVAVGVSYRYMTQAARGQRNMSPRVQARMEAALGGPAEIAAAEVRQPAARPGQGADHLHQGAGPGAGHEHEGTGGKGRGQSQLPLPGGPGPAEHGSGGPGQDGGRAGGAGQDRTGPAAHR